MGQINKPIIIIIIIIIIRQLIRRRNMSIKSLQGRRVTTRARHNSVITERQMCMTSIDYDYQYPQIQRTVLLYIAPVMINININEKLTA